VAYGSSWLVNGGHTGSFGCVTFISQEFETAALFLGLGLPSTLICYKNVAFQKRTSNHWNLKMQVLHFKMVRKHFENGAF